MLEAIATAEPVAAAEADAGHGENHHHMPARRDGPYGGGGFTISSRRHRDCSGAGRVIARDDRHNILAAAALLAREIDAATGVVKADAEDIVPALVRYAGFTAGRQDWWRTSPAACGAAGIDRGVNEGAVVPKRAAALGTESSAAGRAVRA